MAALKYWVWLASLPGVGSRAKLQLLEHFSSPEEIYYAQPQELLLTGAVNKAQAQLLADKSLARAEDVLSACAKTGQFIVTMDDTTYPSRLRDIFDPPLLLYGKGSMPLFDDEAAIAVVGTRSCTAYGLDVASQLGYELARQGALVLSGMAKGIDGAAMKGALRAGGFTAAVWMWSTPPKTGASTRTWPPPVWCCPNTRPAQSRWHPIFPSATASLAA